MNIALFFCISISWGAVLLRSALNILSVSSGYVAAVIGAGFASGQEIVSFFVKYGKYSIWGIVIACFIFSVFAYIVLSTCIENKIHTYTDFLNTCFKRKTRNLVEIMTLFFAVSSVCVMTACAGEMGAVILGFKRISGACIFLLLCGIIFLLGSRRVMKINSALGAVIVFGMIFCCFYILRFREHQVFKNAAQITVSGTIYAGYNLITAGAILSGMSRFLKDKREAALSAFSSGFIIFLLITLIWGLLGIYHGKINLGEIPMLTVSFRQNALLGVLYCVMLFLAVLTTGISNGFGVIDIAGERMEKKTVIFLMLFCAFCMSGTGFSRLINTVYRICGYAGIIFVFAVVVAKVKNTNKIVKKRK